MSGGITIPAVPSQLRSPQGTDIVIQPGLADAVGSPGTYVAGTVRNTNFPGGLGNPTHSYQGGAICYTSPRGIVEDKHGIGHAAADADQGHIEKLTYSYNSIAGGGFWCNVAVDVDFGGVYSFNATGAASRVQIVLAATNTLGFRVYHATGAKDLLSVTLANGVAVDGNLTVKSATSSLTMRDASDVSYFSMARFSASVALIQAGAGYGITVNSQNGTFTINATGQVVSIIGGAYINPVATAIYEDATTWQQRRLDGGAIRIHCNATGVAFNGATPVAQAARAGQLTDSSAGTPGATLAAIAGAVYTTDVPTLRNWIASLAQRVNALETIIHNSGLSA